MDREAEDFFWWGVRGGMGQGAAGKIIHSTSGPRRWEDMRSTGEKRKEWIQRRQID